MRVYERPDKEADALTQEVCKQAWVSGEPLSWGLQIGRSVFVFVLGKGGALYRRDEAILD